MIKRKSFIFVFASLFCMSAVFSQEAIHSVEDDYYDYLTLQGAIERPYLNHKTLSDLQYNTDTMESRSLWNLNRLDSSIMISDNLKLKLYSPESFSSYNTAAPYGTNDGGLWQGKGFNTSLTFGVRLETYGFEFTFKPQLSFSQNQSFAFPSSNSYYKNAEYQGKAEIYGNYGLPSIDAPQRFGTKSFWNFDWGDTEIRYSFKSFTLGFGTEYLWLGPAVENPIIHSNNAQSYPKLDFGIRKQKLEFRDWNLGTVEFRYWLGQLTESDYFDNNQNNNKNLIAGLTMAYEIPFIPGFILAFNRTMLSKWDNLNGYTTLSLLIPAMKEHMGYDESDQRASVSFEYFIPKGGIDLYFEWGKNDYNSGIDTLIRYPFHTQAITAGFKKNIDYPSFPDLSSQLIFELTYLESSMDYHFFYDWGGNGNNFYTHARIKQGYTNRGQYLGAGIGSGGNSQYVAYKLFYPKGYTSFFIQRVNPDLNYFYFLAPRDPDSSTPNQDVKGSINVNLTFGLETLYFLDDHIRAGFSLILEDEHNPMLINPNRGKSEHRYNFVTRLSLKYLL